MIEKITKLTDSQRKEGKVRRLPDEQSVMENLRMEIEATLHYHREALARELENVTRLEQYVKTLNDLSGDQPPRGPATILLFPRAA